MKLNTKITELSHEDIVELLSTATYGSYIFSLGYDIEIYSQLPNADQDDCMEDKCAKLLLADKPIRIYDISVDDEEDFYGTLPHFYDKEGDMGYIVSLEDIKKGIEKALDNGGYDAKCARHFIDYEEGMFDINYAERLMQIIVFGDIVYC